MKPVRNQNTIAETNNFIVLEEYSKKGGVCEGNNLGYQSEHDLEEELLKDLRELGYQHLRQCTTKEALLANARQEIEQFNEVHFTDSEWQRFMMDYLDRPNETQIEKSEKVHHNHRYDFTFDNGKRQIIDLFDKENLARNRVQVISQMKQQGAKHLNRYDVTILVNGLPLVHVELKRRGVAIHEAFNQVHRYSKESLNDESSLYRFVQLFVISNGSDTRYFANTLKREKQSFDFTMNWARADNSLIKDLKDFTATFFEKRTLLQILFHYSVFNTKKVLMVMRPYQIAATERIIWQIRQAYNHKKWGTKEAGGYIWHTTGSGKTLTSFKAARLATQLDFIDKVFFVVDRKDLDHKTMSEYQLFSPDSVNGSQDTAGLKSNILKDDNRIIVTTIQKLNKLIKSEPKLSIYDQHVVFIFDEAHRSQFGEAQKNLKKRFKKYYQFGFTGTPIFPENSLTSETTQSVFGRQLHSYVITDAIRDAKVLKFKVDYNNVRPEFKEIEQEQDEVKLSGLMERMAFLHPNRIERISRYILDNFRFKTHRHMGGKGFNAMLAVDSVQAAKQYYETLNNLQKGAEKPLKIATIYSFAANEEQSAKGEIIDEGFEVTAMESSAKEFLAKAIEDYNAHFGCSYGLATDKFENYYKDISKRVINQEVDLLIVVGMFLTGFDAPTLNTLFVDKNLRYHGLLQAYSRTNRIHDATKSFGNIVTFRDLEQPTIDAITLFGDKNTRNILLERSFKEYLEGFKDILTGLKKRGYKEVVGELMTQYPDPAEIELEADKKAYVELFGEYLRLENILQNFDEYTQLKALHKIPTEDSETLEAFKEEYQLTDTEVSEMREIDLLPERLEQNYRSTYNDIREWLRRERENNLSDPNHLIDWDDIVFEIELLKSQEINLDYILELLFEHHKKNRDKESLIEEMRRIIRANIDNRAKEGLIVDFINETELSNIADKAGVIEQFFTYAQAKQREALSTLIAEEGLHEEPARRYVDRALRKEYVSDAGTDLNELLPRMSPLAKGYLEKKERVYRRIVDFVEKFKGIGRAV